MNPGRRPTFTPQQFEEAVLKGSHRQAVRFLSEFLELSMVGGGYQSEDEGALTSTYTWWADRVMQLLADPTLKLRRDEYLRLAGLQKALADL